MLFTEDATNFGRHTYAGGVAVDMWFIQDKVNGGTIRLGVTPDSCIPLTESKLSAGPGIVVFDFVLSSDYLIAVCHSTRHYLVI